jgi:hypothetical protein
VPSTGAVGSPPATTESSRSIRARSASPGTATSASSSAVLVISRVLPIRVLASLTSASRCLARCCSVTSRPTASTPRTRPAGSFTGDSQVSTAWIRRWPGRQKKPRHTVGWPVRATWPAAARHALVSGVERWSVRRSPRPSASLPRPRMRHMVVFRRRCRSCVSSRATPRGHRATAQSSISWRFVSRRSSGAWPVVLVPLTVIMPSDASETGGVRTRHRLASRRTVRSRAAGRFSSAMAWRLRATCLKIPPGYGGLRISVRPRPG